MRPRHGAASGGRGEGAAELTTQNVLLEALYRWPGVLGRRLPISKAYSRATPQRKRTESLLLTAWHRRCTATHAMSLCVLCGAELGGDASLCAQHHAVTALDWAAENRIMCDFLHRGIVPKRPFPGERGNDPVVVIEMS